MVGASAIVYSVYQWDTSSGDGQSGAFWGGLALGFAGSLTVKSASNLLSGAIWEYNRTLTRAP